jgi:hypothetical protein
LHLYRRRENSQILSALSKTMLHEAYSGQGLLAIALHEVQCPAALTRPLRIWHVPHPPVPVLKNVQPRHVFLSSDDKSVYSTDLRNAKSAPLRSSGSVQLSATTVLP